MFLAKQAPFLLFFGGSVKDELYIICKMFKYQSRVNDVVLSYIVDAAGVLSYVDTAGVLSYTVDVAAVLSYVFYLSYIGIDVSMLFCYCLLFIVCVLVLVNKFVTEQANNKVNKQTKKQSHRTHKN